MFLLKLKLSLRPPSIKALVDPTSAKPAPAPVIPASAPVSSAPAQAKSAPAPVRSAPAPAKPAAAEVEFAPRGLRRGPSRRGKEEALAPEILTALSHIPCVQGESGPCKLVGPTRLLSPPPWLIDGGPLPLARRRIRPRRRQQGNCTGKPGRSLSQEGWGPPVTDFGLLLPMLGRQELSLEGADAETA